MATESNANETEVEEIETEVEQNGNEGSDEKKYSDKEMNDISKKNVSKAEKKLLKSLGITDVEKAKEILKKAAEQEAKDNDTTAKTLKETVKRAVKAEVKNVLAENGLTGKKADRMIGLIDLDACCDDDGNVDSKKVEDELKNIKDDFPELFNSNDDSNKGFKFGSDGENEIESKNSVKPAENRKKWNRFNK